MMNTGSSNSRFLVLKVGGSLFSNKRQNRSVDGEAVAAYAQLIADLVKAAPGGVAFISGGGSFGHPVAQSVDPSDTFGALPLTEANFSLKWIWTVALRKAGVFALPFQLTSICAFGADGLMIQGEVLLRAIGAGVLPVLSGDCLIGPHGALTIFPSDRVPEIFVTMLPGPVRVVTLTDVPGIVTVGPQGSRVHRYIHPEALEAIYEDLWETPFWDTTQSMRGKLEALAGFARMGAECIILKGDTSLSSLRFLLEPVNKWPEELLYTRISLEN